MPAEAPSPPIFVDTSIPMYAAGKPSLYKEACVRHLLRIEQGELKAAIDTEVIQEILYRYGHLRLHTQAIQLSRQLLRLGLKILPVTKADAERSLDLQEKYMHHNLPPRDLLHVAVMLDNDMTRILSVDKHFDKIEEVQRLAPLSFPGPSQKLN